MSEFRFLDFPILRFPLSPILRFSDFPHPPAPHSPLHHYPFFIGRFTFYIPNPQSSVLPRHAGQARSSTHETRNLKRETPPSDFPIGPEPVPLDVARNGVVSLPNPPKGRFPTFSIFPGRPFSVFRPLFLIFHRLFYILHPLPQSSVLSPPPPVLSPVPHFSLPVLHFTFPISFLPHLHHSSFLLHPFRPAPRFLLPACSPYRPSQEIDPASKQAYSSGMSPHVAQIVAEALELPPPVRAFVAEKLLESLDTPGPMPLRPAWKRELRRRCQEVDRGSVILREASTVFEKAFASLT